MEGGLGNDVVFGGLDGDILWGVDGDDYLFGEEGNDQLHGGAQNDWLYGGDAYDRLWGDAGDDRLHGNDGNDILDGGAGNDELHGGGWYDTLHGGAHDDRLYGGGQDDYLYGGDGNDSLHGGEWTDRLYGEAGDDVLDGGLGGDDLWGGAGADRFVFSNADVYLALNQQGGGNLVKTFDRDFIFDFNAVEGDKIDLTSLLLNITGYVGSSAQQAMDLGYLSLVEGPGRGGTQVAIYLDRNGSDPDVYGDGGDVLVGVVAGTTLAELGADDFIVTGLSTNLTPVQFLMAW